MPLTKGLEGEKQYVFKTTQKNNKINVTTTHK